MYVRIKKKSACILLQVWKRALAGCKQMGMVASPDEAYATLRSLRTVLLRLPQQVFVFILFVFLNLCLFFKFVFVFESCTCIRWEWGRRRMRRAYPCAQCSCACHSRRCFLNLCTHNLVYTNTKKKSTSTRALTPENFCSRCVGCNTINGVIQYCSLCIVVYTYMCVPVLGR